MEELFKERKEKLNLFKSFRNKLQDKKRIDVPDGLYTKCDTCGESILSEDLKENYYVCPACGAHLKMRAYTRLNLLYDGGECDTATELVSYLSSLRIDEIDYMVASHYDSDHVCGRFGREHQ